jgi:hypothetical protein
MEAIQQASGAATTIEGLIPILVVVVVLDHVVVWLTLGVEI